MASKPTVSLSVEQIVEEVAPNPAAVVMQFLLLYKRNLLTAKRFYVSISSFLTLTHLASHAQSRIAQLSRYYGR